MKFECLVSGVLMLALNLYCICVHNSSLQSFTKFMFQTTKGLLVCFSIVGTLLEAKLWGADLFSLTISTSVDSLITVQLYLHSQSYIQHPVILEMIT